MRNAVQHLIGEVQELETNGRPLWGSLSWHYMESPATGTGSILLLMPGTVAPTDGLPSHGWSVHQTLRWCSRCCGLITRDHPAGQGGRFGADGINDAPGRSRADQLGGSGFNGCAAGQ